MRWLPLSRVYRLLQGHGAFVVDGGTIRLPSAKP